MGLNRRLVFKSFLLSLFCFLGTQVLAGSTDFKSVEVRKSLEGTQTDPDTIYAQKAKISRQAVDQLFRDHGIPTVANLPEQLDWVRTTSWHKLGAAVDFKCDQLLTPTGMNSIYNRTQFVAASTTDSAWKHFQAISDPPVGNNVSLEYMIGCGKEAPELLKSTFKHSGHEVAYLAHINYNYSAYYDVFVFFVTVSEDDNGYAKVETSAVYSYKSDIWGLTKSAIEGKAISVVSDIIRRLVNVVPSTAAAKGNWSKKN